MAVWVIIKFGFNYRVIRLVKVKNTVIYRMIYIMFSENDGTALRLTKFSE